MSEPGTRYTILTSTDQSANIWVVALICIALTSACLGVRVVSKLRVAFKFEIHDYVFGVAWAIQVVQVGLIIKALTLGLGKDISIVKPSHISSIQTYTAASTIVTYVSLYVTKVSLVLLIQRLFVHDLRVWWIGISILGLATALEIETDCVYPTCTNHVPRNIVALVFDVLTELVCIALPIYCIRGLRMRRARKAKVLASFTSRGMMIVFAALTLWGATKINRTGQLSTTVVLPLLFLQLELCFSLCIVAVIPCFRMIFQSSEKIATGAYPRLGEPKRDENGNLEHRPYPLSNTHSTTNMDTEISFIRSPTPPPPKKPEHSAQSSQDMGGANSSSTGRVSESSLVPSATTGLSQKPLFHAPVP